jgi:hypothetical protein
VVCGRQVHAAKCWPLCEKDKDKMDNETQFVMVGAHREVKGA